MKREFSSSVQIKIFIQTPWEAVVHYVRLIEGVPEVGKQPERNKEDAHQRLEA